MELNNDKLAEDIVIDENFNPDEVMLLNLALIIFLFSILVMYDLLHTY
jgi:hypothetical protein